MTHICVGTTVRAAKKYGYHTTLISDAACATKDLEWHGATIPASIDQNTYIASLHQKFSTVMTSQEYFCYASEQ